MKTVSAIQCLFFGFTAANHVVVSLGSSYAAGVGLTQSYGKILSLLLQNFDGASSTYIQGAKASTNLTDIPRQAAMITSSTTIVTLTSGGNDVDYIGCLFNAMQASCSSPAIDQPTYTNHFNGALDAILSNLQSKVGCPTCVPIYVVTYPQALGSDTACSQTNTECTFSPTQVTQDTNIYNDFTSWTVSAFNSYQSSHSTFNLHLLDMRPLSAKHDVGSQDPWINGQIDMSSSNNGQKWHPTKDGVTFIASAIFANNKNQPSPTPRA